MFNPIKFFKKKKEDGENKADNLEEQKKENSSDSTPNPESTKTSASQEAGSKSTPANLVKITTEIDRLKASVESFGEVRKGLMERMSGLNEQIGELRAMIMDRDRTIQEIELKAIKASDLVESVQPDKLMIELQKEDAKFEALKANLEGNESIMNRIMEELKEMRRKLDFFRGIEEIIKLSEEVKKELIEIKKVEASININTDKVQTIYAELRKKFKKLICLMIV